MEKVQARVKDLDLFPSSETVLAGLTVPDVLQKAAAAKIASEAAKARGHLKARLTKVLVGLKEAAGNGRQAFSSRLTEEVGEYSRARGLESSDVRPKFIMAFNGIVSQNKRIWEEVRDQLKELGKVSANVAKRHLASGELCLASDM